MKAYLRHVEGHTFVAKSDSNHWVPIDTGTASGGTGAANDPFQLFVIGFSGCALVDVADIVKKSRKEAARLEMFVEVTRAETAPKVVRSVEFHLQAEGDPTLGETLRRALELSLTKYCSASLSLDRAITFRGRVTVNGEASDAWDVERKTGEYYTIP
ncbi:OsmC family protein [bacterium]|nr:OsmC family protein [bacterium]MBU1983494.1 OsmC family protein [bacterium]